MGKEGTTSASDAISLAKKLSNIVAELKAPKNLENKFAGFSYRSAEGILESVKPLLKKYDCTLVITDDIIAVGDRVYVKATVKLFSESEGKAIVTSAFAREPLEKKGMDSSQLTGATSSYARKYALNGLFCIDDNKDADSFDNSDKSTKKPAAKKAPAKKTTYKKPAAEKTVSKEEDDGDELF